MEPEYTTEADDSGSLAYLKQLKLYIRELVLNSLPPHWAEWIVHNVSQSQYWINTVRVYCSTATHSRLDLCECDVRISTQHHSLLLDPERTLQEAAGLDQGETTKGKVGCERSQKTNLQGVQAREDPKATKQHLVSIGQRQSYFCMH